jgi:hypothetical protein
MTGNRGRPDVRLLAELDAGLLDEATAREVRAAAEADPAARAVLAALAATRAELAALPERPVPPALAERWSAALAAEQSRLAAPTPQPSPSTPPPATPVGPQPATPADPKPATPADPKPAPPADPQPATPVGPRAAADPLANRPPATRAESGAPALPPVRSGTDPAATPQRRAVEPATVELRADPGPTGPPPGPRAAPDARSRQAGGRRGSSSRSPRNPVRWLRRPAVLAAALLVAVAVVAGLRARPEPPPTVERPQLVAEALSTVGVRDTAGLADPTRRAGCLRAVGAPAESPEAPLLGGRRVTFEGAEGVLLVLGTGRRGAFDVVIVDPDCGPGSGRLLAATRVTPP